MDIVPGSIKVQIGVVGKKTFDLSVSTDALSANIANFSTAFTDGEGANKAELVYHDTVTLADGASTELDLAGSLSDVFGDSVVFTKLKAFLLKNTSADASLHYGHSAANQVPIVVAAGDGGIVGPGGFVLNVNPSAAGFAITAGTGDLLKLEHDGVGTDTMDVDVYLLGEV